MSRLSLLNRLGHMSGAAETGSWRRPAEAGAQPPPWLTPQLTRSAWVPDSNTEDEPARLPAPPARLLPGLPAQVPRPRERERDPEEPQTVAMTLHVPHLQARQRPEWLIIASCEVCKATSCPSCKWGVETREVKCLVKITQLAISLVSGGLGFRLAGWLRVHSLNH